MTIVCRLVDSSYLLVCFPNKIYGPPTTPGSGLDMKELRPQIQSSLRYRNQTTHQRQSTKRRAEEEEATYVKGTHPLIAAELLSAPPFVSKTRFHSLRMESDFKGRKGEYDELGRTEPRSQEFNSELQELIKESTYRVSVSQ